MEKDWKRPKHPLMENLFYLWFSHTVEYTLAIKINETAICAG